MAAGKILMKVEGDWVMFRVVGNGTFENAISLKACGQSFLEEGIARFTFDMTECSHLDSTFMGVLVGLGLKMRNLKRDPIRVLHAKPEVQKLLRDLGLDNLLLIEDTSS